MPVALALATLGISIGIAWCVRGQVPPGSPKSSSYILTCGSRSTLGVYLGELVYDTNPHATMAIRAVFLTIALLAHGYIRSVAPRLFIMVLLTIIPVLLGLVRLHWQNCALERAELMRGMGD